MDLATSRASTPRIPWRTIGVLAVVALLLGALLVAYAGSQRRVPAPFGQAANGVIPFDRDGDILVGDPVTGASRLVVGGPENDYGPTFSPDGTRIGFIREAPDGELVMTADADGGNVRQLTPTSLANLVSATWTPASDGLVLGHDVDGGQRLERYPVDGSPPRLLLEGANVDWFEYRPPAGAEVLFRGQIDGQWGLFLMASDGSDIRPLAYAKVGGFPDQDLNFVSWTPDGSRIHYNRYTPEAETIQAWVMDADGSNQRRFNPGGPPCCWWEGEQAVSPDGKWVLMHRVPPPGEGDAETALFPADGSGEGVVVGPQVKGTALWRWAPDSTMVLLNYNDPEEGNQLLVDPFTGSWTEAPWTDNAAPDWQRLAP